MELIGDGCDLDLVNFFWNTLTEIGLKPESLNSECLTQLKNAYSSNVLRNRISSISYGSQDMRTAYIMKYSPCFAGTVACNFHNSLQNIPSLALKVILQDSLTLCCLGGGSTSEIVGICTILEKILQKCSTVRRKQLVVKTIVIDIESGWAETAEKIVGHMNKCMDQSVVRFEFGFMKQDFTETFSNKVKCTLRSADVVTMVKVLSAVYGSNAKVDGFRMMQELVNCIRDEGVLFFLDSSGFLHYDFLQSLVSSFEGMVLKYQCSSSVYCMSFRPQKHPCALQNVLVKNTKNKVNVWVKKEKDDVCKYDYEYCIHNYDDIIINNNDENDINNDEFFDYDCTEVYDDYENADDNFDDCNDFCNYDYIEDLNAEYFNTKNDYDCVDDYYDFDEDRDYFEDYYDDYDDYHYNCNDDMYDDSYEHDNYDNYDCIVEINDSECYDYDDDDDCRQNCSDDIYNDYYDGDNYDNYDCIEDINDDEYYDYDDDGQYNCSNGIYDDDYYDDDDDNYSCQHTIDLNDDENNFNKDYSDYESIVDFNDCYDHNYDDVFEDYDDEDFDDDKSYYCIDDWNDYYDHNYDDVFEDYDDEDFDDDKSYYCIDDWNDFYDYEDNNSFEYFNDQQNDYDDDTSYYENEDSSNNYHDYDDDYLFEDANYEDYYDDYQGGVINIDDILRLCQLPIRTV